VRVLASVVQALLSSQGQYFSQVFLVVGALLSAPLYSMSRVQDC
jgi:hypothetical protein